jgi:hypothetical protein
MKPISEYVKALIESAVYTYLEDKQRRSGIHPMFPGIIRRAIYSRDDLTAEAIDAVDQGILIFMNQEDRFENLELLFTPKVRLQQETGGFIQDGRHILGIFAKDKPVFEIRTKNLFDEGYDFRHITDVRGLPQKMPLPSPPIFEDGAAESYLTFRMLSKVKLEEDYPDRSPSTRMKVIVCCCGGGVLETVRPWVQQYQRTATMNQFWEFMDGHYT